MASHVLPGSNAQLLRGSVTDKGGNREYLTLFPLEFWLHLWGNAKGVPGEAPKAIVKIKLSLFDLFVLFVHLVRL